MKNPEMYCEISIMAEEWSTEWNCDKIGSSKNRTAGAVLDAEEDAMRKGTETRERILAIAEASVLSKGFAATSIEEVIAEAGITKSGFFYHFKDKNELAHEMMHRYIAENDQVFDEMFGRAAELSDDPLQAFLIGLKLLAEMMADLPNGHPGCLIALVCYQERLFDRKVVELSSATVRKWNARFRAYLDAIAAMHAPREAVDLDDLAAMFSCIVDGGIIMSKVLNDPRRLSRQVLAFRSLIKMLFAPAPTAAAPKHVLREMVLRSG